MSTDRLLHLDRDAIHAAYDHARAWADGGYSDGSRSYWAGMRDTLAVVLGITTVGAGGSRL